MKSWGPSLFGALAVVSILLAGATVWLFVTDPLIVVNAVNDGEITPLVQSLALAIYEALRGLLKYL